MKNNLKRILLASAVGVVNGDVNTLTTVYYDKIFKTLTENSYVKSDI